MPVGLNPLFVRGCCVSESLSCANGDLLRKVELEGAGGVKLTRSAHQNHCSAPTKPYFQHRLVVAGFTLIASNYYGI
jgi:hypothetical protein